jgi:hypothetical protein
MRVRDAKDFLVAQAAEQASLEGVPLADLEKRMMYFTESGYVPEDPIKLNEEFEAQYDRAKYEKKISNLMQHAYKRLRIENPSAQRTWYDAIRRLKRGDHYLLVMWGQRPGIHAPELIGLAIGIFVLAAFAGLRWVASRFHPPSPHLVQGVFLVVVLAAYFFRTAVLNALSWLLEKTIFRLMGQEKGGEDSE